MGHTGRLFRSLTTGILALAVAGSLAAPAQARKYTFERNLRRGSEGSDVRALQVRIAGWLERSDQRRLRLTGSFDGKTENALIAFQTHYGLRPDGIAGPGVYKVLRSLEDRDGSTEHFDWAEFRQKRNDRCGKRANRYAGTFKGGKVPRRKVRANVMRLMWRLEALRAKLGDAPIGINSGFRSVPYNKCIGGASLSQHMYGTAADLRVADVGNRRTRNRAKESQVHGISCYASFSHNHMDLRLHNSDLPEARFWWWPDRDRRDRDLDESGSPCWGERKRTSDGDGKSGRYNDSTLRAIRDGVMGAGTLVPSRIEIDTFEDAPEPFYGGLAD